MIQLSNYLLTHRKRLALSQEEVGFLLGIRGESKGAKVCRDEKSTREPSLQIALAYEAIFERPVRELFAGLYEQMEQEVAERAKILTYRKHLKSSKKTSHKLEMLRNLAVKKIS